MDSELTCWVKSLTGKELWVSCHPADNILLNPRLPKLSLFSREPSGLYSKFLQVRTMRKDKVKMVNFSSALKLHHFHLSFSTSKFFVILITLNRKMRKRSEVHYSGIFPNLYFSFILSPIWCSSSRLCHHLEGTICSDGCPSPLNLLSHVTTLSHVLCKDKPSIPAISNNILGRVSQERKKHQKTTTAKTKNKKHRKSGKSWANSHWKIQRSILYFCHLPCPVKAKISSPIFHEDRSLLKQF